MLFRNFAKFCLCFLSLTVSAIFLTHFVCVCAAGGDGGLRVFVSAVFVCLFFCFVHVLLILCRKEVKYFRQMNYILSNRYTLSSLRANLFVLPVLWVMVSLGNDLRVESLYLAIVTFTIVRDFVVWRLSLGIAGAAGMLITLSRIKVRLHGWRKINRCLNCWCGMSNQWIHLNYSSKSC